MGVALAANIENAKKILTLLVNSLSIPVTCKIRIRKTTEETISHVKELQSTGENNKRNLSNPIQHFTSSGIKAIAIHGRTRDERPQHKPHPGKVALLLLTILLKPLPLLEVIKAVAESIDIPVICNGGSKEIEKYSDIFQYKKLCGASSIMIARAAEWNASIFRPKGLLPMMDIIKRYLTVAVDYDAYPANVKYCIQNILRDQQESELGKQFLDAQTLEQICTVFDMRDYFKLKQAEFKKKGLLMRRDVVPGGPDAKRIKLYDNLRQDKIAFIRSNYAKDVDLPKSILHAYTKKKLRNVPVYETEQNERLFRSILSLHGEKYSSTFWEKNKKNAEQGAAIVCLLHLGLIDKEALIENGSYFET